jgi:plastocyanin
LFRAGNFCGVAEVFPPIAGIEMPVPDSKETAMWRVTWKFLLAGAVASVFVSGWFSGRTGGHHAAAHSVAHATTAPAPATLPAGPRVTIDNFAFSPQVLTVAPGTTVTWLNRDDVPHTATSSDSPRKFNSGAMDTDETFSHAFTRPGTYRYYCAVHPKMTATIIVK